MFRRAALAVPLALAACFGLGFLHGSGDKRVAANSNDLAIDALPNGVKAILENKCADCHSNRTHWPLYSRFAPVSWLVERDVHAGRAAMNLSLWRGMRRDDRISSLTRIVAEARAGRMPPKTYALMHPDKRLSTYERQILIAWATTERRRIRTETDRQETANQ